MPLGKNLPGQGRLLLLQSREETRRDFILATHTQTTKEHRTRTRERDVPDAERKRQLTIRSHHHVNAVAKLQLRYYRARLTPPRPRIQYLPNKIGHHLNLDLSGLSDCTAVLHFHV